MEKRRGRPMKYARFLETLEDYTTYSPALIVAHGEALGLFPDSLNREELRMAKQRVRITMGRLSYNHNFPVGGDGLVFIDGQAPVPGWFGFRWKSVLK